MAVIPTHHAWIVDLRGRVIDPTWAPDLLPEKPDYYGVHIPTNVIIQYVFKHERSESLLAEVLLP